MPTLARKFAPKGLRLAGLGVLIFLFILALTIVPDAKGAFSWPFQSLISFRGISQAANTAVPENIIFTAEFLPAIIGPGSVSTLRFVITNADQTGTVSDLAFSNVLPAGVTIALPANAQATCDSLIDAPDGGSTIGFGGARLGFNQSCTITVDVTSSTPGTHRDMSGDLTSNAGNSGPTEADLDVVTGRPGFSQSFSPDSVSYGGRSTVTFTIDNTANASSASNLSFTDNLPLGMVVADPANAVTTCTNGVITAVPGTAVIGYTYSVYGGVSVPAGSSCIVTVDVMGNAAGQLNNVTGELTSLSNMTLSSGKASAALNVTADHMSLVESFIDDPAAPGSNTTVEFTIHNLDRTRAAENIVFTNDVNATLSGLVAIPPLPSNPCGSGSALTGTGFLTLAGGSLPAEGSCTFTVTLQIPGTAVPGTYPNTTSSITADIDGHTVTGSPAAENLYVAELPSLTMTFLDTPVSDGSVTSVEFTITNNNSSFAATNIAFTNNLDAFISGITGASLPSSGFCGLGSNLIIFPASTGQSLIMTNGSLAAGASCTFIADLLIPVGTPPGIYTNQTDRITAVLDGQSVTA
ncbi:MAG: hypothetical protein H6667_15165, partial [Ardenticatenaceae bacterium]|nr:hypothetical protein [Ardenticatenaceae bacterium]